MKKGIFALAMSAALMLAGTSALADYTFTVHHSGSTSHPYQKGSEYFNEKLTEYSNGTMNLDIYPSNQLAAGCWFQGRGGHCAGHHRYLY